MESLKELEVSLARLGSRLLLVPGRSVEVVPRLAVRWKAERVLAHRWVEPFGRERDRRVAEALDRAGVAFCLFEGETLLPPGSVRNGQGGMFRVFTPFGRACGARLEVDSPWSAPKALPPLPGGLAVETVPIPTLEDLGLVSNPQLQTGGESSARRRLERFVDGESGRRFLNELLWREFSHHLLWEWPELLERPFREAFHGFPWREDEVAWRAWTEGRTGYPVVDAAARQLMAEGFVHNRARMVAASFLAKHLLLDYRRGEAHYLRWLTDGDWAQNNAGWQWSAGCGCDAQPWFHIFNPMAQGLKFDPEGLYVKRWVPELADCPAAFIHEPWKAPKALRTRFDYPDPILDHALARERFLAVAKGHLGGGRP